MSITVAKAIKRQKYGRASLGLLIDGHTITDLGKQWS
jgi:hypothetical protein